MKIEQHLFPESVSSLLWIIHKAHSEVANSPYNPCDLVESSSIETFLSYFG